MSCAVAFHLQPTCASAAPPGVDTASLLWKPPALDTQALVSGCVAMTVYWISTMYQHCAEQLIGRVSFTPHQSLSMQLCTITSVQGSTGHTGCAIQRRGRGIAIQEFLHT